MYNKFLSSEHNVMNIQPIEPEKVNLYYVGVFNVVKNAGVKSKELYEVKKATSGSGIEGCFPLIIDCMNRRGNWKMLTTDDAINIHHLDFCWSNATKLNTKASIHSRLVLDSIDHYISNKEAFYRKFKNYSFIPEFESITKENIYDKISTIETKFKDSPIIIKPDKGFLSKGILVQNSCDYDKILEHIYNFNYDSWTISKVIKPKLINGYVVSNRIYFLVTKDSSNNINGYIYSNFMNFRAEKPFMGDITNHDEFLTNYMDKKGDPDAYEKFVKTRYIPNKEYMTHFTSEEQYIIYNRIINAFNVICKTMSEDLMSYNENKINNNPTGMPYLANNKTAAFHIYGADVLINEDLNVKIIELNGAPGLNVKTRYYGVDDRLDYFDLMEEVFQKVVDPIFPPKFEQLKRNTFMNVYSGKKDDNKQNNLPLFYIPISITIKYPFILEALRKRPFLKRTKNLHDKIDLFYGLRERYITDETNMNYYDELLNYLTSKRTRNAPLINKIQGVTYYLANKGRIYEKLLEYKSPERIHRYHPVSELFYYDDNDKQIKDKVINFNQLYPYVKDWIVKPVHGSRGQGIEIFNRNDSIQMANYICDEAKKIMEIYTEDENNFNDEFRSSQTVLKNHKYWIVSQYINPPHLIKLRGDTFGRKYNIRFYVLLSIDNKLPRHKDVMNFESDYNVIKAYIYDDAMIYFSMLEYNAKELPDKFKDLDSSKYLDRMVNITNLEVVNNVYDELNEMNPKVYHNKEKVKKDLTTLLSKVYGSNTRVMDMIKDQAENIIIDTINAVKYDLRPLNRHLDNYKGCFNLLAYDTMLDSTGKMWLIEINRGPDIKGLQANIGDEASVKFYDDIFKLTVDPHYIDTPVNQEIDTWKRIYIDYNVINLNKQ